MNEESLKEKLILATMSLIKEDDRSLTARRIAKRAGAGVGLINYHFQTKANLVNIAAQRVVDEVIGRVPGFAEKAGGTPEKKLKQVVKATLDYLCAHPNVSRLSILHDMENGSIRDNTQRSILAYDEILKEILPDERKRALAGHMMCAAMQSLFLRAGVLFKTQGFQFSDKEQRDRFAEEMVDTVVKGLK